MKHLSGEKTDSKIGQLKNSFIFFVLFFPSLSYSQIPINGFCFQKNYSLPKDYQGIISADLNSNGNDELIFYSTVLKRIGIYTGVPGDTVELKEFQLNSEFSQLKQLKDKTGNNNLFAAVERRLRKISLMYISLDSIDAGKSNIEFDSYPENIFTGDIDLNGTEEILVSGSGFDGLSILFRSNGGIGEKKITTGTSFSEAIFVDLNDDGYLDVLAFNILENSLQFFINNTNGIFRLSRSIQYSEKINLLKSLDLNNSGIHEIIYAIGNRIEILLSDGQGSYKNKNSIKLDDRPFAIQFGDFNGDKITDLAVGVSKSMIDILFGKSGAEFHEKVPFIKNSSLTAFTQFRYKNTDNISCLLQSGELIILNSEKGLGPEMKLTLGIQAGAVKKFDYLNDGIPDIIFIDEHDNLLKILLNNKAGIPSRLYNFPLADDHKEILVDEFFSFRKFFYCFTKGAPLLEVFRYNFDKKRLNRKQLYAPGEILDVALQRIDSTFVNIFLVYNKQSKLYLGKFENRDLSVTFREYPFIDRNVISAQLFIEDEPVVYYWRSEDDTLQFKSAQIKSGPNDYNTFFEVSKTNGTEVNLFGADNYINEYPTVVSILQNETEKKLLVMVGDKFSISNQLFRSVDENNIEFSRGFFGETSIKGIINFTLYSTDDNYINKLVYREKERTFSLNQMFAAENVSDYFFARLDRKNYYLVYSNKKEGYLSITSLKK
ncbi:MAG TPA: VCBS repeat-containing protein [Ignavibacteriaceae bacterium]|nr:VCBS repeat-containing protein [Ignavibacteriaceae bacterium]